MKNSRQNFIYTKMEYIRKLSGFQHYRLILDWYKSRKVLYILRCWFKENEDSNHTMGWDLKSLSQKEIHSQNKKTGKENGNCSAVKKAELLGQLKTKLISVEETFSCFLRLQNCVTLVLLPKSDYWWHGFWCRSKKLKYWTNRRQTTPSGYKD